MARGPAGMGVPPLLPSPAPATAWAHTPDTPQLALPTLCRLGRAVAPPRKGTRMGEGPRVTWPSALEHLRSGCHDTTLLPWGHRGGPEPGKDTPPSHSSQRVELRSSNLLLLCSAYPPLGPAVPFLTPSQPHVGAQSALSGDPGPSLPLEVGIGSAFIGSSKAEATALTGECHFSFPQRRGRPGGATQGSMAHRGGWHGGWSTAQNTYASQGKAESAAEQV